MTGQVFYGRNTLTPDNTGISRAYDYTLAGEVIASKVGTRAEQEPVLLWSHTVAKDCKTCTFTM